MTDWPKLQFAEKDWELQSQKRLVDGFFQLDQLTLTHRGYLTDSVGPMVRELLVRTPACSPARISAISAMCTRLCATPGIRCMPTCASRPWRGVALLP